ncbi:MAG TPA: hypothetical protein VEJ45_06860 [Candidatus Acidoferrales bacterium]|nr:hypothetical protein [Candidatus Acidoferrales bacterium]
MNTSLPPGSTVVVIWAVKGAASHSHPTAAKAAIDGVGLVMIVPAQFRPLGEGKVPRCWTEMPLHR